MHPFHRRARIALALLVGLTVSACTTTTPITGSGGPPAASAKDLPSRAPSPSATAIASASPDVVATVAPSDVPEPTPDPTPEPTEDQGTAGPGCGTGRAGFFAHRGEVPTELQFGGATVELTTAAIGLRNETFWADDVIPGGVGLTADELAVRVDPGTRILLRARDVTLTRAHPEAVPWSTVDFSGGLGSSPADPVDLDWRVRPDGAISIAAPTASGDYMVAFQPVWQTTCLAGDGTAYGRIKVN